MNPLEKLYESFGLDIPYSEMHKRCNDWNPELPLKGLPDPAREIFLKHASELHEDLKTNQHSLTLRRVVDGHDEYFLPNHNSQCPPWYTELFWQRAELTTRVKRIAGSVRDRPKASDSSRSDNDRYFGRPRIREVSDFKREYVLNAFKRIAGGKDGKFWLTQSDHPKKWQHVKNRNGKTEIKLAREVASPTEFKVRTGFSYDTSVRGKILERLTEGYYEGGGWVPGDVRVCTFWGLEDDLRNILLANGGLEGLTDPAEIQVFRDLGGVELDVGSEKSIEESPEGCPF